jgi:hypothetical protein
MSLERESFVTGAEKKEGKEEETLAEKKLE